MENHSRQAASYTAFSGLVMLLYGAYLFSTGFSAVSSAPAIYSAAIELFKWTLLVGGLLLLVTAVVCAVGHRAGLILDAVISGVCGALLVGCAGIWFAKGRGFDIQDAVVMIFGVILVREAMGSWKIYVASASQTGFPVDLVREPEPIHPASIRPESIPEGDEPPAEGYLAAMAKDKQEPPSASYE